MTSSGWLFGAESIEGLCHRNAPPKASQNAALGHSGGSARCADARVGHATKLHGDQARLVLLPLFGLCRPAAVARLVIPARSQAVNGVPRSRLRTHVGKECAEVVQPSLAYGDALGSVSRPCSVVRVRAALLHGHPRVVFGRSVSSCGVPVLADLFHRQIDESAAERINPLARRATTTHGLAVPESSGERDLFVAAVAETPPARSSLVGRQFRKDEKASESGSSQIEFRRHSAILRASCFGVK
jgi:hypothetical protein